MGQVIVWWRTDCCFTRNRNVDLVLYDQADPALRTELLRVPVSGDVNPPNPTILDLGAGTLAQVVHLEHTLATDLALVLTDITPAQAGTYTFVASNALRVRTSTPATVAVKPRPNLAESLVVRYRFATAPGEDNVIVDDAPANPAKSQVHNAVNRGATWEEEVTDGNNVTRQGAIHFDGTNRDQQIAVAAHPDLDSQVGTICFWMKGLPANTTGNSGATLFDRRTSYAAGSLGDSLSMAPPERNPAIYADHEPGCLFNQSTSTSLSLDGVTRLDDDAWHHVAYVYDMASIGITAFYVDAKLDNEKTDGYAGLWPATQELEFGRSWDAWSMAYSGYLDDIHVFNRVLNAMELAQVMTGLPPTLTVTLENGQLNFTWTEAGYVLQQNANVTQTAGWTDVSGASTSPVQMPLPPAA